jgi:hypothetical protein
MDARDGSEIVASDGKDGHVSRRMIGRVLGAAAVGVVGAAALVDATAGQAAAADGNPVTAGAVTTAEEATTLEYNGAANPGVVFLANATAFDAGASDYAAALAGWGGSNEVPHGIYGYSEATGSAGGDAVIGLRVGFPGSGVHGIAYSDDAYAVLAENFGETGVGVSATGGTGVTAFGRTIGVSSTGDTTGVSATGGTTGVHAAGKTAVQATGSGANAVGVSAGASGSGGRGAVFSGAAAQARLLPGTGASHPKSGERGDLYVDTTGRLWFCKSGGTSATWHQLA